MTIISVAGRIASGKDTISDYLITNYQFKKMSFASSLKDAVAAIFGWDRAMLEGGTTEGRVWRETVDEWWAKKLRMPKLTPRWILQQWGTEVFRVHFHDNIWVASLENRLRQVTENVVITDCRFPNELKMIRSVGGISIRVERGEPPSWYEDAAAYNQGPNGNVRWATGKATLDRLGIHASEYASVGLKYDHILRNDGTIADLHAAVEGIIGPLSDHHVAR